MQRDSLFYRIFQQAPALLFELLPEMPENATDYRFDSVEIKQTSFRVDGVFLPPNAEGVVYFCEVQFQLDSLLYERMLSEASLYFYRHRDRCRDWRLVAIYPSSQVEQKDLTPHQFLLDSNKLVRVYLDQLGDIAQVPVGIGLMLLTMLEDDAARIAAQQIAQRVQVARDSRAIMELLSTILVYKFTHLSREEIDRMLASNLKETRVYQELELEIIVRQLKRRFGGDCSEEVVAQLEALSVEQLDNLSEALLDFVTMSDLLAWLEMQ